MSKAVFTDYELVDALRLKAKHRTWAKAARAAGVPVSTLQKRGDIALQRGLTKDTPVNSPLDQALGEVRTLRSQIAMLKRENDTAETIRSKIYGLAERTPEPPAWLEPKRVTSGFRGVPVALWSDWHVGEVVNPDEVGGVNTFNSEIAEARIKKLVNTTCELCFEHMGRAKAEYPGIVICLGGDMMSGDIHEELAETNDQTPQQSVNFLTDQLVSAIEHMADKFGKVFVPCVPGNHGRATRKPRMKGRVFTSYEWNIYCNLERYFKRDPRVTFLIPNNTDAFFSIYGTKFLLTHGDSLGVKGGDGIIGAIGPIMRGSIKLGNSERQIGRDFDCVLMGHWHQMLWLPNAIVNGTLKGYDEYARIAMRAPYSPPSQALFFVHPKVGITARWEVLLEPWHEGNTKWIEWPEQK